MTIIVGAKGHAKEILDVLEKNGNLSEDLLLFDDVSNDIPNKLYNKYVIIRSFDELNKIYSENKNFILGIGNPILRFHLAQKFIDFGWSLQSIISQNSTIGQYNVILESGVNIMHRVMISNDVIIKEGTLLNSGAQIHHDVVIGRYCEISPLACLTGKVKIGDFSSVGAGAVIIPNIKIGRNCVIGAGSVVNKDIPDNSVAVGVPAKVIKVLEPFNE